MLICKSEEVDGASRREASFHLGSFSWMELRGKMNAQFNYILENECKKEIWKVMRVTDWSNESIVWKQGI